MKRTWGRFPKRQFATTYTPENLRWLGADAYGRPRVGWFAASMWLIASPLTTAEAIRRIREALS